MIFDNLLFFNEIFVYFPLDKMIDNDSFKYLANYLSMHDGKLYPIYIISYVCMVYEIKSIYLRLYDILSIVSMMVGKISYLYNLLYL